MYKYIKEYIYLDMVQSKGKLRLLLNNNVVQSAFPVKTVHNIFDLEENVLYVKKSQYLFPLESIELLYNKME